jgi:hypothetical protein
MGVLSRFRKGLEEEEGIQALVSPQVSIQLPQGQLNQVQLSQGDSQAVSVRQERSTNPLALSLDDRHLAKHEILDRMALGGMSPLEKQRHLQDPFLTSEERAIYQGSTAQNQLLGMPVVDSHVRENLPLRGMGLPTDLQTVSSNFSPIKNYFDPCNLNSSQPSSGSHFDNVSAYSPIGQGSNWFTNALWGSKGSPYAAVFTQLGNLILALFGFGKGSSSGANYRRGIK